jgi:hypothetical protein
MTLNLYKLIFALTAVVCITLLLALGKASESGGFGLLGIIVGYILANGVNAAKGEDSAALIKRKENA